MSYYEKIDDSIKSGKQYMNKMRSITEIEIIKKKNKQKFWS